MAHDFTARRTRTQSLEECLLRDDEGRRLLSDLNLAERAGRAVAPLLKAFHFAIDFTDPAHCRIDGETLVLLVSSADQENRLRQLQRRLRAALATAGLPLTDIEVRIIPKGVGGNYRLDIPQCERPASASGAAALDREIDLIEDPELKETLARLRDTIAPATLEGTSLLEEKLAHESLALAERRRELSILEGDLSYGIDAASLPTDEEVADLPPLAAVRERLLQKVARQSERLAEVRSEIARIDRRLERINDALVILPENPIRAEAIASQRDGEDAIADTLSDSDAPAPVPVSAAAHAALSTLVAETASPLLKKTFRELLGTLTPSEADYARSLRDDIRQEMSKILATKNDERTFEQKKRLDRLTEALSELNRSDGKARTLAAELYGSID